MKIRIIDVQTSTRQVHTRMPFRYGAASLEQCPHLYLAASIQDEQGRTARGIAADNLPPGWFDKAADKDYARQIADQQQVIQWACDAALAQPAATPFDLWLEVYQAVQAKAGAAGLPALLAGFGPSLVERAMLDAVGRLLQLPFHSLLQSEELGFRASAVDPSLAATPLNQLVPAQPLSRVAARHTIGLSDPIEVADLAPGERVLDGLPQSLDEVVRFYGVRYFKIKVSNDFARDADRLTHIAAVLDRLIGNEPYHCTIDGNEQYASLEELMPLLELLRTEPRLQRLRQSVLFIEQPVMRSAALEPRHRAALAQLTSQFPVIIDESDDSLDAFRRALELGYSGTSHKNCKNVFKSLLNVARREAVFQTIGVRPLLSAEDLTNLGTVALQQDLTVLTALAITHAERNGHHYFRGLSHLSEDDQLRALQAHPDLYCTGAGTVRLNISAGQIDCGSLHRTSGLGISAWPSIDGV